MQFLSYPSRFWKSYRARTRSQHEVQLMAISELLCSTNLEKKTIASLHEVEFKIFSQFGDDGIIHWLVNQLKMTSKTFVEFGVENYQESNTRFLLRKENWSGLVMDGSSGNVKQIRRLPEFWKHELHVESAFIDAENINRLLTSYLVGRELGLLHIDIDGNEYWIWKAINVVKPALVVIEYNAVFGVDRAITVPYRADFLRTKAHFSNLYFGTSLPALGLLAKRKGYEFVGCNSAGNNAYFVRSDCMGPAIKSRPIEDGFVNSKFRESRDENGNLTYVSGEERSELIRGLPVWNVVSEMEEEF